MAVHRYRLAAPFGRSGTPTEVASVEFVSPVCIDVDAGIYPIADLSEQLERLGWEYVETDPTEALGREALRAGETSADYLFPIEVARDNNLQDGSALDGVLTVSASTAVYRTIWRIHTKPPGGQRKVYEYIVNLARETGTSTIVGVTPIGAEPSDGTTIAFSTGSTTLVCQVSNGTGGAYKAIIAAKSEREDYA